jgi:uncharacterized protein YecT (DUF1311 family)
MPTETDAGLPASTAAFVWICLARLLELPFAGRTERDRVRMSSSKAARTSCGKRPSQFSNASSCWVAAQPHLSRGSIWDRIIAVAVLMSVPSMAAAADVSDDPTAVALDQCLARPINASTAGQTDCEAMAMRSYDRRMNVAYGALMRRLTPAAAERLRRSQRAWLTYRDSEAGTRSALYATRRGTMFVPMEADAAVMVVGDRARLLERYVRVVAVE